MPITAARIAEICHVSRTTVDRALKDRGYVNAETKRRILEVARANNYRPNSLASSLSTGKTQTVGVVVFNLRHPFFSHVVDGAARELVRHGLRAYVAMSDQNPDSERCILDDMMDRHVGGVILLPIGRGPEFEEYLRALPVPVVIACNEVPGFPFVGGDDRAAVGRGMEHLAGQGLKTIHFVCPPYRFAAEKNIGAQGERARGYRDYMDAHPGLSGELIYEADYMERVLAILDAPGPRPGIFCSSDHYALKIMKRMQDRGWNLRERCALMGFDGLDVLDYLSARPASMRYPAEEIGGGAARLLHDLMEDAPGERRIVLPCPLLPGA